MRITSFLTLLIFFYCSIQIDAQETVVKGSVSIEGIPVELAQVIFKSTNLGTLTKNNGKYQITNIPYGTYTVEASYVGYSPISKTIVLNANASNIIIDFNLTEPSLTLDAIVVTGTKTQKRQTETPVIVNVINSQTLSQVEACTLSEGLKFQPGLRVETDCQTCNYTQLRINGLAGGYSQILINGRPIFSPLTGLYGLEQIPTNMIDRIEVVRGAGSSLYGSSAIGGTVNVITKIPRKNDYEISYLYQNIDAQTSDHQINGNATIISENQTVGGTLFVNRRNRGFYDANNDLFSELPKLENTALGTNIFYKPNVNEKLELNASYLNEYRFGGDMNDTAQTHLKQQAEERTHHVFMASADYQVNFNNDNTSFISYAAWQNTDRDHYTGILPDENTTEYLDFISNPPYGTSEVSTFNIGVQLDHRLNQFFEGSNVLSFGSEYILDDVLDEISAYNYRIDQSTKNFGVFLQSDWMINSKLTVLSGIRMDKHNLIDNIILNPRLSVLYKLRPTTQFRLNYGTGFRAPQAFDTDLHIAFAGGGISRVSLSPYLKPETSHSFSTSVNFDKAMENWITGFTLEGFYTRLNDAFFLQPTGEDEFGERFEKQNGDGAVVYGATLELRANINRKWQFESGLTIQNSKYDNAVQYIDDIPGIKQFVRTPNEYGYALLTYTPNTKWRSTLNYIYTGGMTIPHFAGAPNQAFDEIISTKPFSELNLKVSRTIALRSDRTKVEIYSGLKNIFNSYQNDFDLGKNRDSNFVYGPSQPRTFFVGLKIKSN